MKLITLLFLLLLALTARAETAVCHVTYGGETRLIAAAPTTSPLTVPTSQMGSYFLFRLVFEERVAIKITVYADRDEAPFPLHQAIHPWPPATAIRYGFTGLHFVYEPMRDGELEYWCELQP